MTTLYIELRTAATHVHLAAAAIRRGRTSNPDTLERAAETMDDASKGLLSAKRLLQRILAATASEYGECACGIDGIMSRSEAAMDRCITDEQGCVMGDAIAWIDSVEDPR